MLYIYAMITMVRQLLMTLIDSKRFWYLCVTCLHCRPSVYPSSILQELYLLFRYCNLAIL